MLTVRLTSDAKNDLTKIRKFTLERWGAEQTKNYIAELRTVFKLLSEHPDIGKKRTDVSERAQSIAHASHVIYYVSYEDSIVIFAILHHSMVPENHISYRYKQ